MADARSREYAQELTRLVVDAGLAAEDDLVGCSDDEIAALEARISVSLPRAYQGFLHAMGRDAGDLFVGTDMFYEDLPIPREVLQAVLDEDDDAGGFVVPDNAVVFVSHQGYVFLYLLVEDGNDDPPVFLYTEEEGGPPRQVADHFTQWFAESVADHTDEVG